MRSGADQKIWKCFDLTRSVEWPTARHWTLANISILAKLKTVKRAVGRTSKYNGPIEAELVHCRLRSKRAEIGKNINFEL